MRIYCVLAEFVFAGKFELVIWPTTDPFLMRQTSSSESMIACIKFSLIFLSPAPADSGTKLESGRELTVVGKLSLGWYAAHFQNSTHMYL